MNKKTILVDFDGVIHKYSRGWDDGTTYDGPMEGAKEALAALSEGWRVVIFSTRDNDQIRDWLERNGFPDYEVTSWKIPATAIIDDRAIRFTDWEQALSEFKSHYGA
jgi:Predicted sugar phosphatases of the HAD superfamily